MSNEKTGNNEKRASVLQVFEQVVSLGPLNELASFLHCYADDMQIYLNITDDLAVFSLFLGMHA